MRASTLLASSSLILSLAGCSSSPPNPFSERKLDADETSGGAQNALPEPNDPKKPNAANGGNGGNAGRSQSGHGESGGTSSAGATSKPPDPQGGAGGSTEPGNSQGGASGSASAGGDTSQAGGGAGAIGGEGGAGGSPLNLELIDDLEDNNVEIIEQNGRSGRWFGFHDHTSGAMQLHIVEVVPERDPSQRAMSLSTSGYSAWGSGLAFPLNDNHRFGRRSYDASKYRGIAFWARANVDNLEIKVQFPDSSSVALAKLCQNQCDNHFLTTRVVSEAWVQYFVDFAELKRGRQDGPQVTSVDTKRIFTIEFLVPPNSPPCELVIDDVSFTY